MNKRQAVQKKSMQRVRKFWKRTRRYWTWLFMLAAIALLVQLGRDVKWHEVWRVLRDMPPSALLESALLVPVAYLTYTSFDLIGRAYTRHTLGTAKTMAVAFVSYAVNLNLGALVGGVGLRFRLYSKMGLRTSVISKVLAMSIFTNWLGYLWLFGVLFALHQAPAAWGLSNLALQLIGAAMLVVAASYLALCAFARRRHLRVGKRHIPLPSLRIALTQSVLAMLCWGAIGGILYLLFEREVSYTLVLAALLLSSIAGALVHIPGGVGVLEVVFVAMLAPDVSKAQVLGTLLAYRAVYYLAPLAIALAMYATMEARLRGKQAGSAGRPAETAPAKAESQPRAQP
ncbi:lysylphosphatidylglycerol synthase domain-containing protein [Bordetella petrii]|uniref:lysylphosphatidylglycerol synthase domain-containing protein n=1 Tax=Bordetella petrii TaxID=94624 RepID=UPI001E51E993|nr:lysylphosphatidylglycerol synthase domain-containing protein [Bordetella petrii]MCD0504136.1 lysylphosphatidylglycerol synthase domain-containing protein [Bordetella petrii]